MLLHITCKIKCLLISVIDSQVQNLVLDACEVRQKYSRLIKYNVLLFFLKNGPIPASFSFIFSIFKQTTQFLQQINAGCWDSNLQPLDNESLPITTRPVANLINNLCS